MKTLFRLILCLAASFWSGTIAAQERSQPPPRSSLCNRESALTIVEQQIDFAKTFADDVARITVLLRSADLIWAFEEKRARAVYADAFDLATRNHNEKGDELTPDGKILIREADPRYTVIGAIAKHDSAWARRLTEQMLKAEQQEAEDKVTRDAQADVTTAERLLTLASSLISSNESMAVNFARETFRYPATFDLSVFLYRFATRDKSAADEFYREALAAYANAPMERLLYLSSYPFGNDREAGEMPGYMIYYVPEGFAPNPNLQRSFVQAILRRVQNFVENPYQISGGTRVSDPEEMWLALTRLQAQIRKSLPDLATAVESAIENLDAKLSPPQQKELRRKIDDDNPPKKTFDEQVEAALKNPNVDRRDEQLTLAILHQSNDEALDHVLDALDKIADTSLRQPLLNWIYFDRALSAIKDQKLDEARKLAAKVEELDQRAFLYSRIAEESLKQNPDQSQAHEVLEEVLEAATKAPNTMVKVRVLLGIGYLYTKFDMNRATTVIGQVVQCINRIEHPDFRQQAVIRRIEGKKFASYAAFVTPGFTPENAFREIGKVDFDGTLNQASNLSDKSLRALTILAIVEQCLNDQPAKPKLPNRNAPAKP